MVVPHVAANQAEYRGGRGWGQQKDCEGIHWHTDTFQARTGGSRILLSLVLLLLWSLKVPISHAYCHPFFSYRTTCCSYFSRLGKRKKKWKGLFMLFLAVLAFLFQVVVKFKSQYMISISCMHGCLWMHAEVQFYIHVYIMLTYIIFSLRLYLYLSSTLV